MPGKSILILGLTSPLLLQGPVIGQTDMQQSSGAQALSWGRILTLWQTRCWWAALWAPLLQRCDLLLTSLMIYCSAPGRSSVMQLRSDTLREIC